MSGGVPLLKLARDSLAAIEGRVDPTLCENLLEAAIQEQCEMGTYDFEVNACVLKHYQMLPLMLNYDYVKLIFAKAMMQLPKKDFILCLYLLPEPYYTQTNRIASPGEPEGRPLISPVLALLVKAEQLLQACRFEQFWQLVNTSPELEFLKAVVGFEEAIRQYIMQVVSQSHRAIRRSVLRSKLNADASTALIAQYGWTETTKGLLRRKPDETNQGTHQKISDELLRTCILAAK